MKSKHLKYIAHVTRLGNDSLQKQFLFSESSSHTSKRWKKFSSMTEIDESQLRRITIDRKEFMQLLSKVQKIMEAPDENNFSNREN